MLKYFINDVAQTVRSDWTPILMAEEQRFNSWQGQTFHLFSTVSRPALGPNTVVSLADSKAAGARSWSLTSNDEVKNKLSHTYIWAYAFTLCTGTI